MESEERLAIEEFYGNRTSSRSGIPLMNHILEGCEMLREWGRPDNEIRAFCIHPLAQSNMDVSWSNVGYLAEDYAEVANSYLCKPETDWAISPLDVDCLIRHKLIKCIDEKAVLWMLLADKVQNQKDFRIYHWFTHKRSRELEHYFNLWIKYLKKELT